MTALAVLETLPERLAARRDEFRAGRISEDVFRAHLHGYGFRGHEISAEVVTAWHDGPALCA